MDEIDLRTDNLNIFDQSNLSSCASVSTLNLLHYVLSTHLNNYEKFSYMFSYHAARRLEGNENLNCGVHIRSVLKAIKHYGVLPKDLWKYKEKKQRQEILNLASQSIKMDNVFPVFLDNSNIEGVYQNLKNKLPFVFGITIDNSFSAADKNRGIVSLPTSEVGNSISGHALFGLGIKKFEGKWYVIAQNSRGKKWGDNGYCYLPISYLTSVNLTPECWSFSMTNQYNRSLLIP